MRCWVLLVCAVAITGVANEQQVFSGCQAKFPGSECCRFAPDCDAPAAVVCDGQQCRRRSITLENAKTPATINSVTVRNVNSFIVGRRNKDINLTKIFVEDVKRVTIKAWLKASRRDDSQKQRLLMNIRHVQELNVETGAISQPWDSNSSIIISNVKSLNLAPSALSSQTSINTVLLEDIQNLNVNAGSFSGNITKIGISQVNFDVCPAAGFRGNIESIFLDKTVMRIASTGCFQGIETWKKLVIRDSDFTTVRKDAVTGMIETVNLIRSRFKLIRKNAFNIEVLNFKIDECDIDQLRSFAFNVKARSRVSIQSTRIKELRRYALQGVSITNTSPPLVMKNLTIGKAYNRSLALDRSTNDRVMLRNIKFTRPCTCPAWKIARSAIFGRNYPKNAELKIRRLMQSSKCQQTHANNSAVYVGLAKFGCKHCGGRCVPVSALDISIDSDDPATKSNRQPDEKAASWLPVVIPITAALLLFGLCLFLLLSHRRKRLNRIIRHLKDQKSPRNAHDGRRASRPHHLEIVTMVPAKPTMEGDAQFTDDSDTDDFDDDVDESQQAGEYRVYENLPTHGDPANVEPTYENVAKPHDKVGSNGDIGADGYYANFPFSKDVEETPKVKTLPSADGNCSKTMETGQDNITDDEKHGIATVTNKDLLDSSDSPQNEDNEKNTDEEHFTTMPIYAHISKTRKMQKTDGGNAPNIPIYAQVRKSTKNKKPTKDKENGEESANEVATTKADRSADEMHSSCINDFRTELVTPEDERITAAGYQVPKSTKSPAVDQQFVERTAAQKTHGNSSSDAGTVTAEKCLPTPRTSEEEARRNSTPCTGLPLHTTIARSKKPVTKAPSCDAHLPASAAIHPDGHYRNTNSLIETSVVSYLPRAETLQQMNREDMHQEAADEGYDADLGSLQLIENDLYGSMIFYEGLGSADDD